ncbi:MAG: helix-turn-helix domain-containing protein [Proteobacteria bacterium]|nr:helix-turn-helix domain-containing protein [Pseudomonadota bacterium]
MKAWSFTTDVYPLRARRQAWREAMVRLRLPVEAAPEDDGASASVSSLVSPMGMEFSVVRAGAQTISGRNPDQPAAIWVAALLDGAAVLNDGQAEAVVEPGDIVFGPTGMAASLTFRTRFKLLFINVPRVALDHRLVAPKSLRIGHLPSAVGVNHVFSGLLGALAETLEDLDDDQLRPVEMAVTEFLASSLSAGAQMQPRGPAATREAHLHRVRQTIETLLAEPDLTLGRLAEIEGVSPRYLQKLFTAAGESFTHYIRWRRLERCRLDLISPRYADSSISSICFRWGFNGSAHFSRAFRAQFGVSPREYRRAGG